MLMFFIFFFLLMLIMKNNILMNSYFFFDNFSKIFIILSYMIYMFSYNLMISKMQMLLNISILIMSFFFFFTSNFFLLFFSFEIILLPIMLIGLMWGYQKERMESMLFLMMFTMSCSIPSFYTLLSFIYFYQNMSMMMNNLMLLSPLKMYLIILSFLVKFPIFMFHLWLPKAHVESPTLGSMQLAGVLLKLGSYGMIRFMMFFKIYFTYYLMMIIMMFMMLSMWISIKQMDSKMLVAYNSISHMNIMFLMIMLSSQMSKDITNMMSLTHGLTASMMFFLIGDMYLVNKSRIIFMMQNYINIFILDFIMLLTMVYSNLSTPPMFSFISELYLMSSLYSKNNIFFFSMIIFFFLNTMNSIRIIIIMMQNKKCMMINKKNMSDNKLILSLFFLNFFYSFYYF